MNIVVGSTNPLKIEAVKKACRLFYVNENVTVRGIETSSGQYEQPVGFEKTYAGALTRANIARRTDSTAIAVGIENGIIPVDNETVFDIAIVVVIDSDGRIITSTSSGVTLPIQDVQEARERGFKTTTVGSIMAERLGCDPADPHSSITGGTVSREETLINALIIILSQL